MNQVKLGKNMLVNLTPHDINIIVEDDLDIRIPMCENPPRTSHTRRRVGDVAGIPLNRVEFDKTKDIPAKKEDTYHIVSRVVAESCPERDDLLVPDETVRDANGKIIGCTAFSVQ